MPPVEASVATAPALVPGETRPPLPTTMPGCRTGTGECAACRSHGRLGQCTGQCQRASRDGGAAGVVAGVGQPQRAAADLVDAADVADRARQREAAGAEVNLARASRFDVVRHDQTGRPPPTCRGR